MLYCGTSWRYNDRKAKHAVCDGPLEFNLYILAVLSDGATLRHTLDYCTHERRVNGIRSIFCRITPAEHLSVCKWCRVRSNLNSERCLLRALDRNNSHFALNGLWIRNLLLRWHLYLCYNSFANRRYERPSRVYNIILD